MKKLFAILLALTMLLAVFASCADTPVIESDTNPGGTSTDGTPPPSSSETQPAEKQTLLKAGEETSYIVIYPDNSTAAFEESVLAMVDAINQSFPGVNITCQRAFATWGEDFQTDHEILIGDTGRVESNDSETLLESGNQYVVKLYDSGKLVINAKHEELLQIAINFFLASFVTPVSTDTLSIANNYEYKGENFDITRLGWELASVVPCYWGGLLSEKTYAIGEGKMFTEDGGRMVVISDTNADEFNQYLVTLEAAGFKNISTNTIGANKYAQYQKDTTLIYTYYTDAEKEVRVIHDTVSLTESEFEYTYTAKATDTTTFYQYALMYDPTGQGGYNPPTKPYENCGLADVIKLADNSVIIVDGGWSPQTPDAAVEAFLDFLREITGTKEGEKVRIAAMYFTHGHNDHLYFSKRIVELYPDDITVERVMHNFPTNAGGEEYETMAADIAEKYPDVKFIKLHTGQSIQLADVTMEVLFTHEDMVSRNGDYEIIDFNNTSTVIKTYINGRTFMLFGDWGGNWTITQKQETIDEYALLEAQFLRAFNPEGGTNHLKCDVVQVSHHAINDWMGNIYTAVDADQAFIPQADVAYDKLAHPCFKNVVKQLRATGLSDDLIHFAGRFTYGITVAADGTMTLSSRPIAGADEEYIKLINSNGRTPFHKPVVN